MRERDPGSMRPRPVFASDHDQPSRPRRRLSRLESRALERATGFYQHQEEGIATWPPSVIEWTTKRGLHLTHEGRSWARFFAVFPVLGFFAVLLVPGPYQDLLDAIGGAAILAAFGAALLAMHNWFIEQTIYVDSETASFRLEFSAGSVRLRKNLPDGSRQMHEILRADAGRFVVHFGGLGSGQRPAFGRRIDYVVGSSSDGRTSIRVPSAIWEEWLQREPGRFRIVRSPAEMLGLWWPFSPHSASALAQGLLLGSVPMEVW
jgi:hypothetical protein